MAETEPNESRSRGAPYYIILGVVAVLGAALFVVGCLQKGGVGKYWAEIDIVDKLFYGLSALVVVGFALWFAWLAFRRARQAPKDD